ncbi:MAG: response regulator [Candidatus Competibacter sp.]|nr:response regulator [Candidatus Competibacter sp.]MDG4583212.1 response regulator [Candidatus Competibacter sp.]
MIVDGQEEDRRTALIIEDNEDNRVLIVSLLQWGGYRTIARATGQSGYEAALGERPDLILLDIQLPDINGIEVLRRIRASRINGAIPIIAMTSYAMAGDRERLMAAGCTGYIEKPIEPTRVLDQIREILGGTG